MAENNFKPAQMFDNILDSPKGWPSPYALDKAIGLDGSVTHTDVKAGMGVHVDPSSGLAKLGGGTNSATRAPVIFFVFQNGDDFDVVGDHGNMTGALASGRGPVLMGLSCTGALELETSAYVTGTYAPGDLLDVNSSGELKVVTAQETSVVCGVVSDGTVDYEHTPSSKVLRFYTTYFPRSVVSDAGLRA